MRGVLSGCGREMPRPDVAHRRRRRMDGRAGLTLIELIVAFTILMILSALALPVARVSVQREKERRLRLALEEMRTAIDRYKDAADEGMFGEVDEDTFGYPPDLETLVDGVSVEQGAGGGLGGLGALGGQQGGLGQQRGAFGQGGGGSFGQQQRGSFGSSGSFGSQGRGSSRSGLGSQRGSGGLGGFGSGGDSSEPQKIRFLRKIPVDPITGTADWGMRAVQDDPNAMSWGGQNVFDVYSTSYDLGSDGTRYSEW